MVIEKRKFKPKQLLDLPHEILDLIFDQIPDGHLARMKDIEPIKPFVLSRLYSSIVIDNSENSSVRMEDYYQKVYYDEIIQGYYVTEFESIESFVSIVNRYPMSKPKKIWVYGINSFVELYDCYREIFTSAKISIIPPQGELLNQDFQKLNNLPCDFDEFANSKFDMSEYYTNLGYFNGGSEWMNRFNRITIVIRQIDKKLIHQPFFLNLTNLTLRGLKPEDAKYIPRSLKQLDVSVKRSDVPEPFLDLPDTLDSLRIFYFSTYSSGQSEINFNFAYLKNLEDLIIDVSNFSGKVNYVFPSSLVTFKFESDYMILTEKHISVCPNLSTLCCLRLSLSDNNKADDPFQFFNKLKELKVSDEFLMETAIEKYRNMENKSHRISIEDILPESLQSLTLMSDGLGDIETDIDISDCEFVLDLSKFKCLDYFYTQEDKLKIINFPISLTKLSLYDIKKIDFKEFKNLMNLEILDLLGYSDLPDLEIESPNLMYVNLNYSKLGRLTLTRLKLSPSVLELKLSCCDIESIDDSFEFPPQLQVLLLDHNKLRHPPSNLPSTLKILSLSGNKFEQLKTIPGFPASLQSLNIEETGITKDKFGSEYDKIAPMIALFEANIPY